MLSHRVRSRVVRVGVLAAVLCALAVSAIGCSLGTQQATNGTPQVAQGPQKWEYSLDVIVYDDVCAAAATVPFADDETVQKDVSRWGEGRVLMGVLHQEYAYWGELDPEDWLAISDKYVQCGQDAFQASSGEMGDEGWEMISYERLQYTVPGDGQFYGGVILDYGYEVMWKRPKTTE